MDWSTIGAAGLNVAGSIFQNKENSAQAQANRDFQERMSNTAHQREVEDLKKAGLNPILSVNGGSSTPTGSMAQMSNVLEGGVSSALQARALKADIESKEANNALNIAKVATELKQQDLLTSTARDASIKADQSQMMLDAILYPDDQSIMAEVGTGRVRQVVPDYYKAKVGADKASALMSYKDAQEKEKSRYYENRYQSDVRSFQAAKQQAELDIMNTKFDKKTQTYDKILQKVDNTLGTVNSAVDAIRPGIRIRGLQQEQRKLRRDNHIVDKQTGEIK